MSLLFQRQDAPFVVIWNGRAGHYISDDLVRNTQQYPPRAPTQTELTVSGRLEPRRNTTPNERREQRIACGMCANAGCDRPLDGEHIRCLQCRLKASETHARRADARRERRANGGIRCTRCKRRQREYGTWCGLCARSAGVTLPGLNQPA